jgi:hypothetical protein
VNGRPFRAGRPYAPNATIRRGNDQRKGQDRTGPGILTRCASDYPGGGRAIGAWIIGWRRAPDLFVCGCCSDLIEPGAPLVDVEDRDGRLLVVCGDCAGGPGR